MASGEQSLEPGLSPTPHPPAGPATAIRVIQTAQEPQSTEAGLLIDFPDRTGRMLHADHHPARRKLYMEQRLTNVCRNPERAAPAGDIQESQCTDAEVYGWTEDRVDQDIGARVIQFNQNGTPFGIHIYKEGLSGNVRMVRPVRNHLMFNDLVTRIAECPPPDTVRRTPVEYPKPCPRGHRCRSSALARRGSGFRRRRSRRSYR